MHKGSWGTSIDRFETLVQTLCRRGQEIPDECGYTFLVDGTTERDKLTYGLLDQRSREIAVMLRRVCEPGDRALLLYPPGLDFVAAFFGCLYAGVIAVPAYPPQTARPERSLPRLQAIITESGATTVLCVEDHCESLRNLFAANAQLAICRVLATDHYGLENTNTWNPPRCHPDTIAFLQYTSGSTASPRGVSISHGNIIHNLTCIQQVSSHESPDVLVSWLPTYHDMGLFAGVLFPLFNRCPSYLMSPMAFLQKPIRWLQAISAFRGTNSGGPNFAFDLCTQKITAEQRRQLDLSSWQIAYNGAEPIRRSTLNDFANSFRECGFQMSALFPVYGLAESTVFVSGKQLTESLPGNSPMNSLSVSNADPINCGSPLSGMEIAIADPQRLVEQSPGEVGEIWVRGPSVSGGYWNLPEETDRTFGAYLSDSNRGPFLRTGDLGFMQGGELFVTGRRKDLIIIHGRKHYPQDIEKTVEASHSDIRATCSAAISLETDDGPRLVILAEVNRRTRFGTRTGAGIDEALLVDLDEIMGRVVETISETHEVQTHLVLLLSPGSIPKTSSGKIQRHACLEAFSAGQFRALGTRPVQLPHLDN